MVHLAIIYLAVPEIEHKPASLGRVGVDEKWNFGHASI